MKHSTIQPTQVHAREIVYWEPIQLAQRLRGQAHLTLFESTMRQEKLGRYSFLACNPSSTEGEWSDVAYGVAQVAPLVCWTKY
jgi:hypothetical protein